MSDDMSNIINNIKNMMDNGNLPDNLQEIVNNFKSNENSSNVQNLNTNQPNLNSTTNSDTNTISPEMIQNLSNLFNFNSNDNNANSNNNSNSEPSIDINTILKMKTIIDSMNQKNDPRANLLYSLKPYLRENKKNKLDQYVNLLKMTKIADIMKTEKKENNKNA